MNNDTIIIEGEECDIDDVATCERCEVQEHRDNMLNTDMGYLCDCCEGDLR